jgi:hypothetical protein
MNSFPFLMESLNIIYIFFKNYLFIIVLFISLVACHFNIFLIPVARLVVLMFY